MQQRHPAPIDSEDNPIDQDEKAQIVLNARQRLMEWEAEQDMLEKFQQARELILGHSGSDSQEACCADSQEACCADCAEHDHRVRTRYAAHIAAMRDDLDEED
ncbi:hypothetical protein [Armatimonas sp.]|uniref:hypothetical protein n=1 Tax=Armatimonas sp. TaxID=1872638 RepID=UPI00286CEA59|nr:hypothetical protein [Armatimonas sp.]